MSKVKIKPKEKTEKTPKRKTKAEKKEKTEAKAKEKVEPVEKEVEPIPKKKVELKCSIVSCGETVKRSFSPKNVEAIVKKVGLQIEGNPKRIHLCEKHYKAIKKELKKERKTERMRHGLPF
ncbi:MAG: hypothetical protein QXV37_02435 [Candidatus Jordarchaeaceae archaeon]